MALLSDMVRNVLVIVLVAGFLEMLLPEGNTRPLVRLCIGMFILIAVLNPVLGFFFNHQSFSIDSWNLPPQPAEAALDVEEEGARIHQTLLNQSQAAVKEKLEEQINAVAVLVPGVEKVRSQVELDQGGRIRKLLLSVQLEAVGGEQGDNKTGRERGGDLKDLANQERPAGKIRNLMHNFYGLEEDAVKIEFEGG